MKVIVIDDENLALESMVRMLQRFDVEVAGTFQDPREALKHHESLGAEVAFMDIEMPEMNGLELASRLQSVNPELHIVFVTAYEQYAIEAFEMAAVDYLLKPIQLKRLDITLKRLQAMRPGSGRESREQSVTKLRLFHHMSFLDSQGGSLEIPWRTTKAKELFAYMIHLGDRTPNKDELLDRIWPDVHIEKAVTLLHTTIYQIRQTLKNACIPLRIEYKEGRYCLDLASGMQVDTRMWEMAVREAANEGNPEKMHHLLLTEYRGDYLETEGYLWAESERERLRALWLEHALKNASQMETSALFSNAISLHQQIQERFPEIEESYFGLMRLFDKLGNTSEVQHQYANLTRMLAADFGMHPDESITKWFDDWNDRKSS
ncbi:response regulator [Cohnella silvisoli]|uniref:Response regulator n=1 Tax=Cohnella silvisoli TaxID=2873699 RepID=A0ABV1KL20_9BACL|nr:response regulator [Cohnella silvisoli]MCD9020823.1 response regulator [Cohnella silvisoli]